MQTNSFANNRFGKKRYSNNYKSENRRSDNSRLRRFRSNERRGSKETIDITRFIQKPSEQASQPPIEIKNTFLDFHFTSQLQNNLGKRSYYTPTPIQDQAIKHVISGRDIVGLANTGTGKTAAFLLPLIDKVSRDKNQKVLIIAPTRELANQISNELFHFASNMQIFSALCVGGLPIYRQINDLKRYPNFVIGTPGRLKDLSERKAINFSTFNNVVIDEVDRMLDMGFIDDIRGILSQLPSNRQSLCFSATLPPKIKSLISSFLINPVTIEVKTGETAHNVDQDIVRCNQDSKFSQLQELLIQPELEKVLIFIETKAEVERVTQELLNWGFKAESIHGDKTQPKRQKALELFRKGKASILVATDVAARGLDIKDITHVINYTLPRTYEDYIHRIGRTGRGNNLGKALTFVE